MNINATIATLAIFATFLFGAGIADAAPYLELGPMVGHVSSTEASLWCKASGATKLGLRISESADLANARDLHGPALTTKTDFNGIVTATGLKPATSYYYSLLLDGKPASSAPYPAFITAPAANKSGHLRFAFVSCAGGKGKYAAGAWGEMESGANVDLLLMLGDNHYGDSTQPEVQRPAYYSHRSPAGFRALTARTPTYGIWDDHDYGPNDSDRTAKGKEISLETFKQFWPNPSFGEDDNPGIYFKFSRGDVDFFMLDCRYHRSPNSAPADGKKTMLGQRQLAWLKQGLKSSTAKLKFVATGSEWQNNGHPDSWTSFKREQADVFNFITENNLEGVFLLSGDRHFTGGYQINGRIIEVTSGPVGSGNFPTRNLPEMFLNIGTGKLFAVFDVNTTTTPPTVNLEVHRAGEGIVDQRDFTWDEINGRKKLAYLPVPEPPQPKSDYPLIFRDNFSAGSKHWQPTDKNAWRVSEQNSNKVYSLHRQSEYKPPYRSPHNISLVEKHTVGSFDLQTRVISTTRDYGHRSMCLFFGYQDPAHFYYVHLGQKKDDHANQIFIVNGAERTKISAKTTLGTPWDSQWHDVRILRDAESGLIEVYWDDMEKPIMTAQDKTFAWGRVGLGSFDDTGNWDDFELYGKRAEDP